MKEQDPQAELLAALGPHLEQVGAARLEVPPADQARWAKLRQVFEAEQRAIRAMLRLADSGLIKQAGYETEEACALDLFPDMKPPQLINHLLVGRHVADDVVFAGRIDLKLLADIARVGETAARLKTSASSIVQLLGKLAKRNGSRGAIVRAAAAAVRALEEGAADAEVRQRALNAFGERVVRGSLDEKLQQWLQKILDRLDALEDRRRNGSRPGPSMREEAREEEGSEAPPVAPPRTEPVVLPRAETLPDEPLPEDDHGPQIDESPTDLVPEVLPEVPPEVLPQQVGPVAAKRPLRRSPFHHVIPVARPTYDSAPTPGESELCCGLTALYHFNQSAEQVANRFRIQKDPIDDDLMLHLHTVFHDYKDVMVMARPLCEMHQEEGRAEHALFDAEGPGDDPQAKLPLEVRPDHISVPMAWLLVDIADPLGGFEHSEAAQHLLWCFGLMKAAREHLFNYVVRVRVHDPISPMLEWQTHELIRESNAHVTRLVALFYPYTERARAEALLRLPEQEERQQKAREADERTVVFGEDHVPPNLAKVATLPDGTHAALTLDRATVTVALGPPGAGKSHLSMLLLESLILYLEGLNRLTAPGIPVVFASDWRKGRTRHQHLRGFFPNPNLSHWRQLRERYLAAIHFSNAAFSRALFYCAPGMAHVYLAEYPDLIERGLEIREARMHPEDWGNLGYNVMLGCGTKLTDRTQWSNFVSVEVLALGADAHPRLLQQHFREAKLGGGSRAAVDASFNLMVWLTSQGERIQSALTELGVPVFFYLEHPQMGPEHLLAFQLCIMNALNREMINDPYVLYIVEEAFKQKVSEAIWKAYEELTREMRHGRRSLYLAAHMPWDLPADVLTNASGVLHFGAISAEALRALKGMCPLFASRTVADFATLQQGWAYGGFGLASNGLYARESQLFHFRPCCLDTGGQTVRRA